MVVTWRMKGSACGVCSGCSVLPEDGPVGPKHVGAV
jgi:hypothetical protein